MSDFYDRQGKPMTFEEWGRAIENLQYKIVARTYLNGEDILVSTVWLGMDHRYRFLDGDGAPIIFETMVFGLEQLADEQWRYETEEQALAGHAERVALVKTILDVAEPGGAPEPVRDQEDHA